MAKGKLQKVSDTLELTRKIVVNTIWLAVVMVVLSAAGWYFLGKNMPHESDQEKETALHSEKKTTVQVDWSKVDESVSQVLKKARIDARKHADMELDTWLSSLMDRVDNSFLDWYYSYWTQQSLGLKAIYQHGVHRVLKEQPTASEKLTEEIQTEFANRVLQPQVAQRILERIVNQTAARYVEVLNAGLVNIPTRYSIPENDWQSYLQDIALTAKQSDGGRQTPLTLKALTVTGTGSVVMLTAKMKMILSKTSTSLLGKSAGKMATTLSAKTGGKVVAKFGGKFFGTIVGFGVLIWDVWDHDVSEKENRPFLRLAISDYLRELKSILLDDPEYGIMSTFLKMEQEAAHSTAQKIKN